MAHPTRDPLSGWLAGLVAAFQFLSRLPVRIRLTYTEEVFRRSVVFYPLVGAVIGLFLAGGGALAGWGLPPFPSGVFVLALWVGLTGALHLDGLMDTADGLLSHRSRERMLEIMKDSRVGAMGVIAGVLVLLAKASLLVSLLDRGWAGAALPLACVPVWSRWWMVASIAGWPYARAEGGGMGGLFRGVTLRSAAASGAAAAALTFALLLAGGFGAARAAAAVCVLAGLTAAAGWLLNRRIAGRLGGLTGDTYGAVNELLELTLLAALVLQTGV
ncbi:adenosylcobinamide-GDP ribazoletransferase [Paenibacillus sp. J31TS4]|uniref:adenosylcobinamide-GDP ribazoletransferase n=1 Tax=Paenibacillus sp. J31TS4 TaxID=2807195 RepID=UPI001B0B66E4|nr:adenosylcobinamide-GDP ribazoletransferase [Paenibacillus sp. J31TS4]GIP38780.1 adenosylcobinamide-GDP ribazoletransferase [Paenibacillus sp. J31TS4]